MNALLSILLIATIPLRNPFWPLGHTGEREPIVDEPHVKVTAAEQSAEEDVRTSVTAEAIAEAKAAEAEGEQTQDRLWIRARKALKIGGTMRASDNRQSVCINGRIYGDGDFVSFNHLGYRFTWRVQRLTDSNTLKLLRVRMRELDETEEKGTEK